MKGLLGKINRKTILIEPLQIPILLVAKIILIQHLLLNRKVNHTEENLCVLKQSLYVVISLEDWCHLREIDDQSIEIWIEDLSEI